MVCYDIGLAGIPAALKAGDYVVGTIRTGAALRSSECAGMRFEDVNIWSSPGMAVNEGGGGPIPTPGGPAYTIDTGENKTKYTVPEGVIDVTKGATYYWRVRTVDAAGNTGGGSIGFSGLSDFC